MPRLGAKLVRRGNDHGLRPRSVEQLAVVGKNVSPGMLGGDGIGIHVGDADKLLATSEAEISATQLNSPIVNYNQSSFLRLISTASPFYCFPYS
jgi:hypothetical protein